MRTIFLMVLAMAAAQAQPQPQMGRGRGAGGGGMVGPGPRVLGAQVGAPGRVVKNAPFSADIVTESMQTLPDGNRIKRSSTVRFYRDSEGRTRREQTVGAMLGRGADANAPEVAFINDPVAGVSYALNLEKRTATKSNMGRGGFGAGMASAQPRPAMRGRSNQNVRTESLGRQIVEGVQADGTRTTMTISAGEIGNENPIQVVTETWYSPELQTYVLSKRSDPRSGESTTRYTNISRAEPSRILFEPPADFKLVESRMRRQ
jgi:hypothetical protein